MSKGTQILPGEQSDRATFVADARELWSQADLYAPEWRTLRSDYAEDYLELSDVLVQRLAAQLRICVCPWPMHAFLYRGLIPASLLRRLADDVAEAGAYAASNLVDLLDTLLDDTIQGLDENGYVRPPLDAAALRLHVDCLERLRGVDEEPARRAILGSLARLSEVVREDPHLERGLSGHPRLAGALRGWLVDGDGSAPRGVGVHTVRALARRAG